MRENQYLPFAHRDKNKSDYYQTPYSMTEQLLKMFFPVIYTLQGLIFLNKKWIMLIIL